MKKYIIIILFVLILLTGCNNKVETDNTLLEGFESQPLYFEFDDSILPENVEIRFAQFSVKTCYGKDNAIKVIKYLKSYNLILDDCWIRSSEKYMHLISNTSDVYYNGDYYLHFVFHNGYLYVSKQNEHGVNLFEPVYRSKDTVDINLFTEELNTLLGDINE